MYFVPKIHVYVNVQWNILHPIIKIPIFYTPIRFVLFNFDLHASKLIGREKYATKNSSRRSRVVFSGWGDRVKSWSQWVFQWVEKLLWTTSAEKMVRRSFCALSLTCPVLWQLNEQFMLHRAAKGRCCCFQKAQHTWIKHTSCPPSHSSLT